MTMTVRAAVLEHRLHLKRAVITAAGRIEHRRVAILTLTDERGRKGFGEAAPLPGFSPETFEAATAALEAVFPWGADTAAPDSLDTLRRFMVDRTHLPASAAHAIEQALLDLIAQRTNTTVPAMLGATRDEIGLHKLVDSAEAARTAVAAGFRTLKIKVGAGTSKNDDACIAAIRVAAPEAALRLDANGAWDADTAIANLADFARHNIQCIEQPVPAADIAGLAAVRAATDIAILADESCRTLDDLQRLIDADAVDGVVVKPMLAGGILPALDMARRAIDAGLSVSVTTSFDSAVGRAGAVHLAAAVPGDLLSCGLDTGTILQADTGASCPVENGRLLVMDRIEAAPVVEVSTRNLRTPGVRKSPRLIAFGVLLLAFAVTCLVFAFNPSPLLPRANWSVSLQGAAGPMIAPFIVVALFIAAGVAALIGLLVLRTGVGHPFREWAWAIRERLTCRPPTKLGQSMEVRHD